MRLLIILAILVFTWVPGCFADPDIYVKVDPEGTSHFTDRDGEGWKPLVPPPRRASLNEKELTKKAKALQSFLNRKDIRPRTKGYHAECSVENVRNQTGGKMIACTLRFPNNYFPATISPRELHDIQSFTRLAATMIASKSDYNFWFQGQSVTKDGPNKLPLCNCVYSVQVDDLTCSYP